MGIAINSKVPSGLALNDKSVGGLAKGGAVIWTRETVVPYFTFQSDTDFTLSLYLPKWEGTMWYSTDTTTWTQWSGESVASAGGMMYMRGSGNTIACGRNAWKSTYYPWTFIGATNLRCKGNIENLLDWETVANGEHPTMGEYCYRYMFGACTALTQQPSLPMTTLSVGCYYSMFEGCTGLTRISWMVATVMPAYCYIYMFKGCTSIKVAIDDLYDVYPYTWFVPAGGVCEYQESTSTFQMVGDTGGRYTGNYIVAGQAYYSATEPFW